jgi:hypothetical protein
LRVFCDNGGSIFLVKESAQMGDFAQCEEERIAVVPVGEFIRGLFGKCSCFEIDRTPVADTQVLYRDVESASEESDIADDAGYALTAVVEFVLSLPSVVWARDCCSNNCLTRNAIYYFSFGLVEKRISNACVPV